MPMPDLTPVTSSNIEAIGHDGTDLYVKFHNGRVWRYRNVPADVHAEMLRQKSPGSFFSTQVKPNYQGEKQ